MSANENDEIALDGEGESAQDEGLLQGSSIEG